MKTFHSRKVEERLKKYLSRGLIYLLVRMRLVVCFNIRFCCSISSSILLIFYFFFVFIHLLCPKHSQIKSSLEEHFGSCGEISRVSLLVDRETGALKGFVSIVAVICHVLWKFLFYCHRFCVFLLFLFIICWNYYFLFFCSFLSSFFDSIFCPFLYWLTCIYMRWSLLRL